ncbi:SAVED domain-containing protein [Actinoallomurus acaciae]|uniref:SAVED domain-containing protein n=1 Tax=Actinoallomurus acaciae TaxID=502577 RepID=A0ABV5YAQ8_9ACTN
MTTETARAASGARLLGDDVQHLVVWYHVLRTQRADSTITELAVEASQAGNVDDLTLRRTAGPDEYWQVKASVDATSPLTEVWLFERPKGRPSLLQRLYASWVTLRPRHAQLPKVVLATTKAIDPTDMVLGARATTDAHIVETLRQGTGPLAVARRRWADHLAVDEAELLEFLECLEIRHALSEKEWREKVQDAAAGARVRADNDGAAVGVQQVRDWVKAPRQIFTPAQLTGIIDGLKLRITAGRPLFVAQALERNPRGETAVYSVDWTDLFEGDDPRERRAFTDPVAARERIAADLAIARRRLRATGISDFEVDGPMRLPLWFAIGAHFCSTAGFTVSAQARDGIWLSSVAPSGQRDLQIYLPDHEPTDPRGRPWAVSVSFATDILEDVEEYLSEMHPNAYHIRARLPTPGRAALAGLSHAQAVIFQLRDELRALRQRLRPSELHLFMAMPGACALLLGHAWDRMPATWTYWDMGEPGRYVPALQVRN